MIESKKLLWRQGDILIQSCDKLPDKERLKRKKGTVLVHGEASGHTHSLADRHTARIFQSLIAEEAQVGALYLEVFAEKAEIVHPEHAAISLNTGFYRIWRQREYDMKGSFRMMVD